MGYRHIAIKLTKQNTPKTKKNCRFVTPITSVQDPGSYVAVMKLGENYYYGGSFKIKK